MVKQSRVFLGSELASPQHSAVQVDASVQHVSGASGWKRVGRASGLFSVGLLAALAAPREAKAIGYLADNTGAALPPNGVVCPETTAYKQLGCYTSWMELADLNGDGYLDQLWASGGSYYAVGPDYESTILFNNGAGIFTNVTPTLFGGAQNRLRQEAAADVDGDGDLDIYQPGGFGVDLDKLWIQTSPGVFVNKADTLLPAGLMSHAASTHMGDLDGDGDFDLVTMDWGIGASNYVYHAILYLNDGTGKFTFAGIQNDLAFASATDVFPPTIPAVGTAPPASASGCGPAPACNTAAYGSALTYWGTRPIDVDFADIDGDFDLDIVIDSRNGYSRLFLNDGHGKFTDGTNWKSTLNADGVTGTVSSNFPQKRGPYVYNHDLCDIDEDGDLDLLVDNVGPKPAVNLAWAPAGTSNAAIDVSQILLNDGHGKFIDDTANRIIAELGADDNAVKCADFSGDGHYDLMVATLTGRSEKLLLNDGTTHFNMINDAVPIVNDSTLGLDAADLNGDKIMDLVTGTGEGGTYQNRVYLGSGLAQPDKTPPAFRAIQVPSPLAETPTVIRVAVRDSNTSEVGQMVKSVTMTYAITGGSTKSVKAVFYGGDLFRATIPAQPAGTEITVTMSAVDRANLTGTAVPFKFTVPVPAVQPPPDTAGAGGMPGTGGGAAGGSAAGSGGSSTGGTAGASAGGTGGTEVPVGGDAGDDTGPAAGGKVSKGGSGNTAGKPGTAGKAGKEEVGAAGEDTGGGTTESSSDDGGCAISSSTPASKGRGAAALGIGLAMLGLVRRRRNKQ